MENAMISKQETWMAEQATPNRIHSLMKVSNRSDIQLCCKRCEDQKAISICPAEF